MICILGSPCSLRVLRVLRILPVQQLIRVFLRVLRDLRVLRVYLRVLRVLRVFCVLRVLVRGLRTTVQALVIIVALCRPCTMHKRYRLSIQIWLCSIFNLFGLGHDYAIPWRLYPSTRPFILPSICPPIRPSVHNSLKTYLPLQFCIFTILFSEF